MRRLLEYLWGLIMAVRLRLRGSPAVAPVSDITLSANSIAENAAQGTVVGTLSNNLGISVSWAITDNSDFQLSASTGTTVTLQRSGTGTLTEGVSESVTIRATASGASAYDENFSITVTAAGADVDIASFTLQNFNSGASSNRSRLVGHVFKLGDVPSTSALVLTDGSDADIAHNVVHRKYDETTGDLVFCHVVQRRGSDISASGSETTKLKARAGGSYVDTPSGLDMGDIVSALSAASKAATLAITSAVAKYYLQITAGGVTSTLNFPGFFKTGYSITEMIVDDSTLTNPTHYTVTNGSGTTFNGQSGYDGITINLVSPTGGDVYCSVAATWTHQSGTLRAAMADAAASPNRIAITIDCPLLIAGNAWAPWKDGSGGAGADDEHARTNWFWWAFLDGAGGIEQVYVKPVTKHDWYDVDNKTMISYTAAFKMGSTTLDTYSSLDHAPQCWWAAVKTEDSNSAAGVHCLIGTAETTNPVYDKDYWIACENFPIFDPDETPNELSVTDTYTALTYLGFEAGIDSGGEHAIRGRFSTMDINCFMLQTANAHRIARVNQYAAHHVGYHCRPGDATLDAPDRCMTLIMDVDGTPGADDTWEADGMPTARYYVRDNRGYVDTYTAPASPTSGGFAISGDSTHAGSYGFFKGWIVDGHEDQRQAQLDLATNLVGQKVGDVYGSMPRLMFYEKTNFRSAFSIPSGIWTAIAVGGQGQTERGMGWALNILGDTFGFTPSDAPEFNFMRDWVEHEADYLDASVALFSTEMKATGAVPLYRDDVQKAWMTAFIALGAETFVAQTKRGASWANHLATYVKNIIATDPVRAIGYSTVCYYKTSPFDPSTNPFCAAGDMGVLIGTSINTTSNVITVSRGMGGQPTMMLVMDDGDYLYPGRLLDVTVGVGGDSSFVSPLSEGTRYYCGGITINATDITFKAYTDAGLTSEVNFTGSNDTQNFILIPRGGRVTAYNGGAGSPPDPNEYNNYFAFVACQINKRDDTKLSDAICDQMLAFNSLIDYSGDARWKAVRV
jgi:hypothetical protein